MAFFNSKIKRFLAAIAGKDTCPDPDSPYERCLADIAERIDRIEENQGQGGGNVLTLYLGTRELYSGFDGTWCYKNPECTEEYTSYEEAKAAVDGAIAIKLVRGTDGDKYEYIPFGKLQINDEGFLAISLYYRSADSEFFDDEAGVYFEAKNP